MRQVHPPTMITLGLAVGDRDFEVNNFDPAVGGSISSVSNDAYMVQLTAEHFFESGFGAYFAGSIGEADDLDRTDPNSSLQSSALFVAVSYRARMNDDFRMPVRFGPYFQTSKQEGTLDLGAGPISASIERSTVGVRLAAEPEYVIFQRDSDSRVSELSAFAMVACGAGPATIELSAANLKEDAYAFNLTWQVGLRYRFPSGLLLGLSFLADKNHYGASESYNDPTVVFNGVDDDFTGVMLTAGWRF